MKGAQSRDISLIVFCKANPCLALLLAISLKVLDDKKVAESDSTGCPDTIDDFAAENFCKKNFFNFSFNFRC